jgi:hypothetical protein
LTSTIRGYNITENAKNAIIAGIARDPLVIPAQELLFYPFPKAPDSNGIHTNVNVPYQNITSASVVFPKTPHQITCYENPMLDNYQLTIGGRFFPKKAYSTFGARFLQEQLIIADLDGSLQATKEYTDSIVNVRNHTGSGVRWMNSLADDTSFLSMAQTEHGDGGFVFDGLDTVGSNVNTEITGTPRWNGDNDTYHYPRVAWENGQYGPVDRSYTSPAPQLWLAMDTFFVIDKNGLHYIDTEGPRGSRAIGQ